VSGRSRHKVKMGLTEEEYAALRGEADRTGMPMVVLLREAFFGESPAVKLLREALFLRQNGERPPGGSENWHDWDLAAELFLRGLLPPEPQEPNQQETTTEEEA
jgi:hypothetical protein